jgi:cysteine desulfurase/selenocysteine lyase
VTTGNLADDFELDRVRADFPILATKMRGRPLVYLDSAASAQKPLAVIDAVKDFYECGYANIHRGVYQLSAEATTRYEGVRETVARFLGAPDPRGVVFVRNVTEAINLVAWSFVRPRLTEGDEVLITAMEHHANIVPWQLLCEQTGARLCVAPIADDGSLLIEEYERLLSPRTKIAAFTHVSNALGTINPVKEMVAMARARGVPTLVDGAQAAPHMPIDVEAIGCDFYGFTGHKVFGPTGVGVLWGRPEHLDAMPPYQGGGDMIETVTFEKSTFAPAPHKFEAGTPNIAGVIGLGVALDYVTAIGLERIAAWETGLLARATAALDDIAGVRIIGRAPEKAAVVSFVMDSAHPHDIGTIFDGEGVAIRAGHHCAQPVMERFGIPATARASFSIYNGPEDVDALVGAIHKTRELFG